VSLKTLGTERGSVTARLDVLP